MARWWVNNPNGASVHYPTKQRAKNVARQVKGASVSKGNPKSGKHSQGCLPLIVGMLAALAGMIAALM